MKLNFKTINCEVLYAHERIVKIDLKDIALLRQKANANQRKTIRLCAHPDVKAKIHEMIIVHSRKTYVRPHKHSNKSISYHIIEGKADMLIFNERGSLVDVIAMGDYHSGRKFFHRMEKSFYYMPLVISDYLIFHETLNGPFTPKGTVYAPWAPEGHETKRRQEFMRQLKQDVKKFLKLKK